MAKWTDTDKRKARDLAAQGLTRKKISERIGVPVGTLYSWLKDVAPTSEPPEAVVMMAPPPLGDREADDLGRATEAPPTRPPEGKVAYLPERPGAINFIALEGHIAGIYIIGSKAIEAQDEILSQTVRDHADKAGHAWVEWIKSEPRVLALVERLQIGTPLGELIGVHVSIVFAYVFARDAARRAAAAASAAAQAAQDGAAGGASADTVGVATG